MLKQNLHHRVWMFIIAGLVILCLGLYLYYDRHNTLSSLLRSLGVLGVVVAIVLMAVTCAIPIPSEGMLIVFLKIYGAWWGGLYAWIGAVLSSLIVFILSRYVGTRIFQSLITQRRFELVDDWVKKRGTIGLLFMRLLPIPGFIVSYIVGTIPSVRLWNYMWTGAVSVIPYYLGASLVYLGISNRFVSFIGIGVGALALFWFCGYYVKRKCS